MNGSDEDFEDIVYYKMLLKNNYISDLTKVTFVWACLSRQFHFHWCFVPITCHDLILLKNDEIYFCQN